MANFQAVPSGEQLSGRAIIVDRATVAVGLWGPLDYGKNELDVKPDNPSVTATKGIMAANVRHWTIAGGDGASAQISAVTLAGDTWDSFHITFQRAPGPASGTVSVWPVTQAIFGTDSASHLVGASVPAIDHIDVPTFRHGDTGNAPRFSAQPSVNARVGVFACSNGPLTRAVLVLVPGTGIPDAVLVGVTHGFGQNSAYYGRLGWSDPLSPPLILDHAKAFLRSETTTATVSIAKMVMSFGR